MNIYLMLYIVHIEWEIIGTLKNKCLTFSDFSLICKIASIKAKKGALLSAKISLLLCFL